jgi:hypothetical protein
MSDKATPDPAAIRIGAARILEAHAEVIRTLVSGGERALREFVQDENQHPAARRAVAEWLANAPASPWGMDEVVQIFAVVGEAVRMAEMEKLGHAP